MLKKYLQKQFLKFEVVSYLPGRLRLKFSHYKVVPKEALEYAGYIKEAIQMLKGIEEVQFNQTIGTVLISYKISLVSKEAVLKWLDTITATGLESAELIEQYGNTDRTYLRKMLEERLKKQLQEMR